MKFYLVMDGRAYDSIQRASVMDTIGSMTEEEAWKYMDKNWHDIDAVLVSFTQVADTLLDGQVVYRPLYA